MTEQDSKPQFEHHVHVKRREAFLRRIMQLFEADGLMSVEGTLKECRLPTEWIVAQNEARGLKPATIWPELDFLVLKLCPDRVEPIARELVRLGLRGPVIHIQIEANNSMQLGAYDHFHPECVVTGPGVSAQLLQELKQAGTIIGFSPL